MLHTNLRVFVGRHMVNSKAFGINNFTCWQWMADKKRSNPKTRLPKIVAALTLSPEPIMQQLHMINNYKVMQFT